mmetsp:Transcript_3114/g.11227  ORF Transcript_3114/g.11227 Transcript_3114/m.11227 type:complete len:280 (-) Transcript_3114:1401-2240(-)
MQPASSSSCAGPKCACMSLCTISSSALRTPSMSSARSAASRAVSARAMGESCICRMMATTLSASMSATGSLSHCSTTWGAAPGRLSPSSTMSHSPTRSAWRGGCSSAAFASAAGLVDDGAAASPSAFTSPSSAGALACSAGPSTFVVTTRNCSMPSKRASRAKRTSTKGRDVGTSCRCVMVEVVSGVQSAKSCGCTTVWVKPFLTSRPLTLAPSTGISMAAAPITLATLSTRKGSFTTWQFLGVCTVSGRSCTAACCSSPRFSRFISLGSPCTSMTCGG